MSEMLGGLPEGARGGEAQEGARGCGVEVVLVIFHRFSLFLLHVMVFHCMSCYISVISTLTNSQVS